MTNKISVGTIDIDSYKQRLVIDPLQLDEELIRQPSTMFEVAEAHVKAVGERDTLKEKLATVDAELDTIIRAEFEEKGKRSTEAIVQNAIQMHYDHQRTFLEYSEAKKKAALLEALKESFHQRGYMLRDLAQLTVANYFETSSVKESPSEAVYTKQRERLANERSRRNTNDK